MDETKVIGEEKKITAGKIGESVWGVVKICILIYCAVGMFIRMTNETLFSGDIESAYSAVQEARMSDLEISVELKKYSGYGYSEAQLAIIEQDLKDGIDVSRYAQKGQTVDEFTSARSEVIKSYEDIKNEYDELQHNRTVTLYLIILVIITAILDDMVERRKRALGLCD